MTVYSEVDISRSGVLDNKEDPNKPNPKKVLLLVNHPLVQDFIHATISAENNPEGLLAIDAEFTVKIQKVSKELEYYFPDLFAAFQFLYQEDNDSL